MAKSGLVFNHQSRRVFVRLYRRLIMDFHLLETEVERLHLAFVVRPEKPLETVFGPAHCEMEARAEILVVKLKFDRPPPADLFPKGLGSYNEASGVWTSWAEPSSTAVINGFEVIEDFEAKLDALTVAKPYQFALTFRQVEALRDTVAEVGVSLDPEQKAKKELLKDLYEVIATALPKHQLRQDR